MLDANRFDVIPFEDLSVGLLLSGGTLQVSDRTKARIELDSYWKGLFRMRISGGVSWIGRSH